MHIVGKVMVRVLHVRKQTLAELKAMFHRHVLPCSTGLLGWRKLKEQASVSSIKFDQKVFRR